MEIQGLAKDTRVENGMNGEYKRKDSKKSPSGNNK